MSTSTAPARVRIQVPRLHTVQAQVVAEASRFNVLNCGRRFGKDVLAINQLSMTALQGYPVAWFAPTYKQLTEVWREVSATLQPAVKRPSEQEHRLELWTGGVVDMWSLDKPDSARGRAYKRVVVNEAASVPCLGDAWGEVIRPTLTDYKGDAFFLSTPKGFNHFKAIYERGQDPEQPEWMSWTFPTAANPFIDPAEIEAARLELPEKTFAQEYLAAFISDESSVFRGLLDAAILEPQEPLADHQYIVACDWGKVNDFSAFSVCDVTTKQQVYLDRSNKIDYPLQAARLQALCNRYKPLMVIGELNAMGQAIIDWLRRMGVQVYGWNATQASKQKVIEDLSIAFEQRQFKILRNAVQLAELQAYEATRTPSGLMRYAAPEGQHDDTVLPLALCWQAMRNPQQQTKVLQVMWEG